MSIAPDPGPHAADALPVRILRACARALRLRCPNCGAGPIFSSWLRLKARCPGCGLALERGEEGYQVGSYMFAIVAAEIVFAAIFAGVLLLTWPSPPWNVLLYGGMLLMVVVPLAFFPFSKTLFLALDLLVRPAKPHELAGAAHDSDHQRG